jgi:hypothetical protein
MLALTTFLIVQASAAEGHPEVSLAASAAGTFVVAAPNR